MLVRRWLRLALCRPKLSSGETFICLGSAASSSAADPRSVATGRQAPSKGRVAGSKGWPTDCQCANYLTDKS